MSEIKYETGELPVGYHLETTWGTKESWHECVILPKNFVAYKASEEIWEVMLIEESSEFRPHKSEKEKAIEEMYKVFDVEIGNQDFIFERLYDAGLRFMAQDTER